MSDNFFFRLILTNFEANCKRWHLVVRFLVHVLIMYLPAVFNFRCHKWLSSFWLFLKGRQHYFIDSEMSTAHRCYAHNNNNKKDS